MHWDCIIVIRTKWQTFLSMTWTFRCTETTNIVELHYKPSLEWHGRSCAWRDYWSGAVFRLRAGPVEWRPPRRLLSVPRQWTGGSSLSGSEPSTPPTSAACQPRGTPAWSTAGSTWKRQGGRRLIEVGKRRRTDLIWWLRCFCLESCGAW